MEAIYPSVSHKLIQIFLKPFRFFIIKLDISDCNASDKFDIVFFLRAQTYFSGNTNPF